MATPCLQARNERAVDHFGDCRAYLNVNSDLKRIVLVKAHEALALEGREYFAQLAGRQRARSCH